MLLRCAVHLTGNGRDIAEQFAKAHPVPRVRANAIAALAAVAVDRGAILERGLADADARVRADCARWLGDGQGCLQRGFPLLTGPPDPAPFAYPQFFHQRPNPTR